MINYYFDNDNDNENELKPYAYQAEATENTMPPDNATRIEPNFKDGYIPCFIDGGWVLKVNNKGKKAYSIETKERVTIDYYGDLKDGFTLLEPFDFCKWNGEEWELDENLKAEASIQANQSTKEILLAESNQNISILQDAVDLDMAEEGDEDKLTAWKKYRVLLNRIDTSLVNVVWPQKP